MQLLNNTGYMNTPLDYMYQNPYYGGVGQAPTPPFYGQQQYNPFMNQPMISQPNIQQESIIKTQDGQEVVNCPMPIGLSSASMPQQFQYQNDWKYQYYGNNQSYYNGYGNNYYAGHNPYKYKEPGYYNPFNSKALNEGFAKDKLFNIPNQADGCNNQYFSVAQQQQAMHMANKNHMETYDMLYNLVGKLNGYDQGEIERKKEEEREERNRQYQLWCDYNREAQLCAFINKLSEGVQECGEYEAPARRRYIEEWNRKHNEWVDKFGEPTLYEFFNEGVGENQYMQCKINDAVRRETQLNVLYDKVAFRQYLAVQHPTYDPVTGLSQYANTHPKVPLTIDDMEIRLPDHIKNTDEFKRKERFINAVMKNMVVDG